MLDSSLLGILVPGAYNAGFTFSLVSEAAT